MKTNYLGISVFVLGLAAVCWVGLGYLGSNLPALAVTLLIAALYLVGALELYRYRQATGSLDDALAALDGEAPELQQWLQGLHPSLRSPVLLRVEGGRAGLPTPVLTPYLVGMLVLLGMLGTLLGMVLTLRGTGMALQTATDLQAVRDSLAAPVSGLGVAFGASIAGVASSAALGLLAALVRRERIDAVQRLDAHIATTLRGHSQAHQREQALDLLQAQAATMPALVERLESMMGALEQQSRTAHAQQARQQEAFHASTHTAYAELAQSVGQSLQASAAEGARMAGQAQAAELRQALEALEAGTSARAEELLERIGERMQSFADGTAQGFASHASGLLQGVGEAHEKLQAKLAERDEQRLAAWRDSLAGISEELRGQWSQLTEQNRAHASKTAAEISTLMQAAAEGPRAAAETIAELRQALTEGMKRDSAMLEERTRMLETLDTLLAAVNSASGEQREAIDALVTTSADLLERVGTRFDERIEAGSGRLEQAGSRLDAGAGDVAALGESLGGAVQAFADTSAGLAERLQAIEGALDRSLARSDEQLAYYVAQAREVVDLSVLSQRQIIDNLQQLARQDQPAADTATARAAGAGAA